MIWLFDNQACRVAFTRAYGHASSGHVRREQDGYEEMRFSRWVEHPTLGSCLVGSFLAGIGMFDVHFPIADVRAATPEEMHAITSGCYTWGSGRQDFYKPADFIGIEELAFILGTPHTPEVRVEHPFVANDLINHDARHDDKHLRPSQSAIHRAVRNIMYNEMGLSRDSLRATINKMIVPIAKDHIAEQVETHAFEEMIINALCNQVWAPTAASAGHTRRAVRTAFADRVDLLVTAFVRDLVHEHLRISLNIDPSKMVEQARTRSISIPDTETR